MGKKTSALSHCSRGDVVKCVGDIKAEHFVDKNALIARMYELRIVWNDADELYRGAVDDGDDLL